MILSSACNCIHFSMRSPCVYYHLYVLRWDPWWLQKERDRTEQNIAAKKGPRKSVTRSFIRLATEYHKFTPKIVYSIGHVFSFPFFWPKSGHVRYRRKKHFFLFRGMKIKRRRNELWILYVLYLMLLILLYICMKVWMGCLFLSWNAYR